MFEVKPPLFKGVLSILNGFTSKIMDLEGLGCRFARLGLSSVVLVALGGAVNRRARAQIILQHPVF